MTDGRAVWGGAPVPPAHHPDTAYDLLLMHYPSRHRAVVRPRLFDAEVLEMGVEIRGAGRGEELGDGELEGVGEFL